MSSFNSFPASQDTLPESSGSGSAGNINRSMSQGGYLSAVVTNHSRPALSPRAVIPSGYSQVINAERPENCFTALPNFSFTTPTQEHEVVYSHFPVRSSNYNNMIPLPLAASRANEPIPQISRALVPFQSQNNGMAGINQAASYNFFNRIVSHAPKMVSSPFFAGSHNNVGFQAPRAPTVNVPITAQQLYHTNRFMAAQQALRANNSILPQLPGTSRAMMPSGYSQVSNAERIGPTNPAMVSNFSSASACQSLEMVTAPFVSNNIIPSEAPVSGVNLAKSSPPTAPKPSDLVIGTASNNVNSLVSSSLNQLTSSIQPVHGRSGNQIKSDSVSFVCTECLDRFSCPQALGGHRSWHSKQRRKQEGRKSDVDIRGKKKFKSKSS